MTDAKKAAAERLAALNPTDQALLIAVRQRRDVSQPVH